MKKLFLCIAGVVCLASCSTIRKSATTMGVSTTLTSENIADLVVSSTKVSLENYVPAKSVRRGGNQNVRDFAVAKLLKENGNADVLVNPEYEMTMKRGKIKKISVTGYPATYKNFRQK